MKKRENLVKKLEVVAAQLRAVQLADLYTRTARQWFECYTQKNLFLTAVLLLSIFPRLIHAEQEGDFTYFIKDGAVTITRYTGVGDAVTIPDKLGGLTVRSIDKEIFSGAESVANVKIPSSITTHEGGIWAYSMIYGGMASITVDPANPAYCTVDGVLFDKKRTTLLKYPSKKAAKHYEIPYGVTRIGMAAFNLNSDKLKSELASVSIPSSVTYIDANNFGGYQSLTTVTFDGNAPELGGTIFYRTLGHLTVRYYKGSTGFPFNRTFKQVAIDPYTEPIDWTSNDNKTIKATFVKLDGEGAVLRTDNGKENKVPFSRLSAGDVAKAKIFGGGKIASAEQEGDFAYSLSNGVVTITKYTGKGPLVSFPAKIAGYPVNAIGSEHPKRIEKKLTTIGDGGSIIKVIIPEGVTVINESAFTFCSSMTDVSLPKSLARIGSDAFSHCTELTKISIPSNITRIEEHTFGYCEKLSSMKLPDKLTEIGDRAFWRTNLTAITIPPKVTRIGSQAFQMTKLIDITIPESVGEMGFNCFWGCGDLKTATFEGDLPSSFGKGISVHNKNEMIDNYQSVFEKGSPEYVAKKKFPELTLRYYRGRSGFDSPKWKGQKMEVIESPKKR